MSQPPVIHSSSTSSTRTSVLQRQCSLGGGGAVVGHAGGVGRGDVAAVGIHGDRDQSEVEPVAAHDGENLVKKSGWNLIQGILAFRDFTIRDPRYFVILGGEFFF